MTPEYGLTPKQLELLNYLRLREAQGLAAPSMQEMAAAVGLAAASGALRLVEGLEARGFVRRLIARGRSVRVVYREHPVEQRLRDALIDRLAALPPEARLTPIQLMELIRETELEPPAMGAVQQGRAA